MAYEHITVFIVRSAHSPTDGELKAVSKAILNTGNVQGFEPWGITYTSSGDKSEVVDRVVYDKWHSRP